MSIESIASWFLDEPARLVGMLALCAAAWVMVSDIMSRLKTLRSQSWPSVPATISRSSIELERAAQAYPIQRALVYVAKVAYEYEVNGQRYQSETIAPGGVVSTSFKHNAEEWTDRFPAGAQVPVYYNPTNPRDCCLDREMHGTWLMMFIAGVFAVIGVVAILS